MLTIDQIIALDKASDPAKLLPGTVEFMKAMRHEANEGRARRDEPVIPWHILDEAR